MQAWGPQALSAGSKKTPWGQSTEKSRTSKERTSKTEKSWERKNKTEWRMNKQRKVAGHSKSAFGSFDSILEKKIPPTSREDSQLAINVYINFNVIKKLPAVSKYLIFGCSQKRHSFNGHFVLFSSWSRYERICEVAEDNELNVSTCTSLNPRVRQVDKNPRPEERMIPRSVWSGYGTKHQWVWSVTVWMFREKAWRGAGGT